MAEVLWSQITTFQRSFSFQISEFADKIDTFSQQMNSGELAASSVGCPDSPVFWHENPGSAPTHVSDPFVECYLGLLEGSCVPLCFPDCTPSMSESVWPVPPDHFEGSQLSKFSLSVVGSALAGRQTAEVRERNERYGLLSAQAWGREAST